VGVVVVERLFAVATCRNWRDCPMTPVPASALISMFVYADVQKEAVLCQNSSILVS